MKAPSTEARLRALFAAFLVVLTLALVAALAAVVYLTLEVRQQSDRNGDQLKDIKNINQHLISCSTPNGRCFKRGEGSRKTAVDQVNENGLARVVCADQPGVQTFHEVEKCVDEILKGRP